LSSQAFGGYTREQLRSSYAEAWRKHLARIPVTPLESLIADVIARHPEYQSLVSDAAAAQAFEAAAGGDTENPFLHMGLHLAVREQLSIDRPPGVRQVRQALAARLGDEHDAEHVLMEALAETLWEAQRSGRPPDERRYLDRARARIEARG
jgi:Asp-tRNA(Asn)/Glu-tRNA(Gln) amidotransferase B subunit